MSNEMRQQCSHFNYTFITQPFFLQCFRLCAVLTRGWSAWCEGRGALIFWLSGQCDSNWLWQQGWGCSTLQRGDALLSLNGWDPENDNNWMIILILLEAEVWVPLVCFEDDVSSLWLTVIASFFFFFSSSPVGHYNSSNINHVPYIFSLLIS